MATGSSWNRKEIIEKKSRNIRKKTKPKQNRKSKNMDKYNGFHSSVSKLFDYWRKSYNTVWYGVF